MGNPTFANPTATIPDLTPVSGLTGAELIWVNQTGADFSATIGDITGFAAAGSLPSTGGQISGNLTVIGGLGAGGSLNVAGPATFQQSPTAPTPPPGDNSNSLATTAFVDQLVATIPAGGTVTSVGLAMPGLFTITGSPVTRAGDITVALNAQNANTVWAGPASGGAAIPAFRALTAADVGPVAVTSFNGQTGDVTLNATDISALAVGSFNGRTGAVSLTAADVNAAGGPYATTVSVSSTYLPLTGGTLTGQLTVTGGNAVRINGASGQDRALNLTTNSLMRWRITSNMDGETGSNAGSNLGVYSFDDTGSLLASALVINRASAAATFAGNVSGGSYSSSGGNAGVYFNPRNGSGAQFCCYNIEGNLFRIWQSSAGDIATFNSTLATFTGQVLATAAGNAGQFRMTPNNNASSYGAMWRNDGSNTYFLLTNQNDAFGTWNGLRPLTINDANGAVSMSQGLTVAGGLTANNINTQYGVVYSALAGNTVAFRWTGALQEFIDGNYNGDIITSSNWGNYIPNAGNYLPLSGGTLTGALTVDGLTTCQNSINYNGTLTGGDAKTYGTVTRSGYNGGWGNNHFNFSWASPYMTGWVDNTSLGSINFSSDYRIKRNIEALGSMWDRVKQLRPIRYNLKDFTPESSREPLFLADDVERWGFVAHELQETLIEDAATGVKDDPVHIQSLNPWTMIAALTKTLQEAMERIEALEAAR